MVPKILISRELKHQQPRPPEMAITVKLTNLWLLIYVASPHKNKSLIITEMERWGKRGGSRNKRKRKKKKNEEQQIWTVTPLSSHSWLPVIYSWVSWLLNLGAWADTLSSTHAFPTILNLPARRQTASSFVLCPWVERPKHRTSLLWHEMDISITRDLVPFIAGSQLVSYLDVGMTQALKDIHHSELRH